MDAVSVRIEGLDELNAKFRRADAGTGPMLLDPANRKSTALVAQTARARAPRRTGRLAGSVQAVPMKRVGQVRAGGAGVPYAPAIHWGRSIGNVGRPPGNHPGQNPIVGRPFLTDTARLEEAKVVLIYRRQLDELFVTSGLGG